MLQLLTILFIFYPLLVYTNCTGQTSTFSKHTANDWRQNMQKEKHSETLSQCSIYCISDEDWVTLEFSIF